MCFRFSGKVSPSCEKCKNNRHDEQISPQLRSAENPERKPDEAQPLFPSNHSPQPKKVTQRRLEYYGFEGLRNLCEKRFGPDNYRIWVRSSSTSSAIIPGQTTYALGRAQAT